MHNGFKPIFDKNSKILILGSFPSVKSREVGFYYGNKQNRFWKMLGQVFGEEVGETIENKKEYLLKHNIALWDIVKSSDIEGSLDKNLKNVEVVDLNDILKKAKIEKIICNGKKAYNLFTKSYPNLQAIYVTSTSSANRRYDIEKWKSELKK
jgi:hypoxanthine-DNA glycosylase